MGTQQKKCWGAPSMVTNWGEGWWFVVILLVTTKSGTEQGLLCEITFPILSWLLVLKRLSSNYLMLQNRSYAQAMWANKPVS